MNSTVKLYSTNKLEIKSFLQSFYSKIINLKNDVFWENTYLNPIDISCIIAAFVDNKENYPHTAMWVSIDKGLFINIKEDNYNSFIKYLFERFPY